MTRLGLMRMIGRLAEPRATSLKPALRNALKVPVHAKTSGMRAA